MRLVILESPFKGKGDTETARRLDEVENILYARRCVRDSLLRGESPIASHLLYTQTGILRDDVPEERALGIAAGLEWKAVAHVSVVYADRGISEGMQLGMDAASETGLPVEVRYLDLADEER